MRVLVTGSRTWRGHEEIHETLGKLLDEHPDMVLVHGACRQGADAIADRWAILNVVPRERHPALWARHGNAAGGIRNRQMVEAGADVCVAFLAACAKTNHAGLPPHDSHGAAGCADLAKRAGIPVTPVRCFTPGADPTEEP